MKNTLTGLAIILSSLMSFVFVGAYIFLLFYGMWSHNLWMLLIVGMVSSISISKKIKAVGLKQAWKEFQPIRTIGLFASIWFHLWPLIILFLLLSMKFTFYGEQPKLLGRNR